MAGAGACDIVRWYNGQCDKVGTNAAVQGMQVPRQEGQAVQTGI